MLIRAFTCCLAISLTTSIAGCGSGEEGAGAGPGKQGAPRASWPAVERPAYSQVDFATLQARMQAHLDDGAEEVRRLRQEARPSAPYAIPAGEDALTAASVNAEYFDHRQAELKTYLEHTEDVGPAREAGERFLFEYLRVATGHPDALPYDDMRNLGDDALQLGSADPLVRAHAARAWMQSDENQRAYSTLMEVEPAVTRAPYSPLIACLVRYWLLDLAERTNDGGDVIVRRSYDAIDATVHYFQMLAGHPNQRIVHWPVSRVLQELGHEFHEDFFAACLEAEPIPWWHVHMLAGTYYRELAWKHRGGGFAPSVTKDGWRKFEEYLQLAAAHYMRAWQMHPEHPEAAAMLIHVSMAGGDPEWSPRDWFQQAVTSQFDYLPAYEALGWSLTPRWGGSHRQMLAFARECIETDRWDTRVPLQSISELRRIHRELGSDQPFGQLPEVVELATAVADGLQRARQAHGRIPADTPEAWASAAGLLVQARLYDAARAVFEDQRDQLHQRDLDWLRMKLTNARGLTYAMTGPAQEPAAVLHRLLTAPPEHEPDAAEVAAAREQLAEARRMDTQPQSQPFYDDVDSVVRQLDAFHAGEWVDLKFDENLSGWYVMAEEVEVVNENEIRLASTPSRLGVQLCPLAGFRAPLVVEAEVGIWPDRTAGQAFGVMYGSPDRRSLYASSALRAVLFGPQSAMAHVFDSSDENKYSGGGWPLPSGPVHRLRVKVWKGEVHLYADRKPLLRLLDVTDWSSNLITFGEPLPAQQVNAFQIRNVRVHRLDDVKVPARGELDRWPDFYGRQQEIDPEDPEPYVYLGIERYERKDYKQALVLLKEARVRNPHILELDFYTGATLMALRDYHEAIQFYERAMSLAPDDARPRVHLAWILSMSPDESLRNGRRAVQLAERACELQHYEDWESLYSLAAAYAEVGNFDEARKWIAKCLEFSPTEHDELLQRHQDTIRNRLPLRL